MIGRRRLALFLVGAALLAAPVAHADGDPASDVLYGGWVFVPFTDKLSGQEEALEKTVLAAKRSGYRSRWRYRRAERSEPCRSSTLNLTLRPLPGPRASLRQVRRAAAGRDAERAWHLPQWSLDSSRATGLEGHRDRTGWGRRTGGFGDAGGPTLAAADGHRLPIIAVPRQKSTSVGKDRIVIAAGALAVALLAAALVLVRRRRA